MLFEAHRTQLDLPIHSGLLPSSRKGPPLVLVFVIIHTEPSSTVSEEFAPKLTALVVAFQMEAVNVHRLEFEIITAQVYMRKA